MGMCEHWSCVYIGQTAKDLWKKKKVKFSIEDLWRVSVYCNVANVGVNLRIT